MAEQALHVDTQSVAIAVITFYPKWYRGSLRSIKHADKVRGDLTLQLLTEARKLGYQVVVVDGKSSKTFCSALEKIEGVHLVKRKSLKRSPAKRQAIRIAAKLKGVKIIVLTEGEKVSFVTDCMEILLNKMEKLQLDIVVPKRDHTLFISSYPAYMYESEMEGNGLYNEALRVNDLLNKNSDDLDMFFGPRAFRNDPKIISLFMRRYKIGHTASFFASSYFDAEEYSNTIFFPIILALKNKLKVESVTVPFIYSKKQKENEEKTAKELFLEKRKTQRLAILVELLHFLSYLEKGKNNGIKKLRSKT